MKPTDCLPSQRIDMVDSEAKLSSLDVNLSDCGFIGPRRGGLFYSLHSKVGPIIGPTHTTPSPNSCSFSVTINAIPIICSPKAV